MKIKYYLLYFSLIGLVFSDIYAQTTFSLLQHNNVRTRQYNNGQISFDINISLPSYEVPKGSSNHTIFAFSPVWIGEVEGSLKGAAGIYVFGNGRPGPIADDYSSSWHLGKRAVTSVHKSTIDDHKLNWDSPGYTVPSALLNWPANGNSMYNTSEYLAPFHDVSETGEYNPELGDYPVIEGDYATFSIYSYDENLVDNDLNNEDFPLEVQVMSYQYQSLDSWLDNTTFVSYRVVNKSDKVINDFKWGGFVDFDIGLGFDDYFGCDSTRNLVYGYNGTDFDPGVNGSVGYGINPPAQGIVLLNKKMDVVNKMTYNESHDLNNLADLNNLMIGNKSDGSPNLNSDGEPTRYLFPDPPYVPNSESMHQLGLPEEDQRNIFSAEAIDLQPGQVECYHYAIVYGRNFQDHLLSVEEVINNTDLIQEFYDNNIDASCNVYFGTLNTNDYSKDFDVKIFPNPAGNEINISSEGAISSISIYSAEGRALGTEMFNNEGKVSLDLSDFNKGMYFLHIKLGDGNVLHRQFLKN